MVLRNPGDPVFSQTPRGDVQQTRPLVCGPRRACASKDRPRTRTGVLALSQRLAALVGAPSAQGRHWAPRKADWRVAVQMKEALRGHAS